MAGLFDTLTQRGFVKQCSNEPELRRLLESDTVYMYAGFDPTYSSLHVGHLVPVMAMIHAAKAGHKPILLIGGGTARIGDPSGKTEMRKMLSIENIDKNAASIRSQLEAFLRYFGVTGLYPDNKSWLADLNYIDFLRDIGRHFSVNRMLSFETYKMRMETGLSFIEFNYQLLQSFDFLELNRRYGCRLQIGGDDQWGNIVAGVDLIRRVESTEAIGLTFPLVTRADGKKMGKTEAGALYLDANLRTPHEFYQYWRNVPDDDVEKLLLIFTLLSVDEISGLAAHRDERINKAKERLAFEITAAVHGRQEAEAAQAAAASAFAAAPGSGGLSAVPSIPIPRSRLEAGVAAVDLFAETGLCASKGEARRLVQQGGARIHDIKIEDIDSVVDASWLQDGELLLRAGKKRLFRVVAS